MKRYKLCHSVWKVTCHFTVYWHEYVIYHSCCLYVMPIYVISGTNYVVDHRLGTTFYVLIEMWEDRGLIIDLLCNISEKIWLLTWGRLLCKNRNNYKEVQLWYLWSKKYKRWYTNWLQRKIIRCDVFKSHAERRNYGTL